jgi:aryl-alcohol dehydrogenase-like predicted oxidoreductase
MATAQGTREFVRRAAHRLSSPAAPPRQIGELAVSPFGFGAYRLTEAATAAAGTGAAAPKLVASADGRRASLQRSSAAVPAGEGGGPGTGAALAHVLRAGLCNVIDTSTTYSGGASESLIGDVLADAMLSGAVRREEVVLVTKVGHCPPTEAAAPDTFEIAPAGVPGGAPKQYSLHPDFVEEQVAASTRRLGTAPDVVLLHNPDFMLAASRGRRQPRAAAHDAFHTAVRAAFTRLEVLVASGTIGHCYGASLNPCGTWWSVSGRRNGYEAPSLPRLVQDAA